MNQLRKNGFGTAYMNADIRWIFTEETLEANIYGFRVQFNVNSEASTKVEFKVFVHYSHLDINAYERLGNVFRKEEINFSSDGLVKKYSLEKALSFDIDQLKGELMRFVEIVKQEGFKPPIE